MAGGLSKIDCAPVLLSLRNSGLRAICAKAALRNPGQEAIITSTPILQGQSRTLQRGTWLRPVPDKVGAAAGVLLQAAAPTQPPLGCRVPG